MQKRKWPPGGPVTRPARFPRSPIAIAAQHAAELASQTESTKAFTSIALATPHPRPRRRPNKSAARAALLLSSAPRAAFLPARASRSVQPALKVLKDRIAQFGGTASRRAGIAYRGLAAHLVGRDKRVACARVRT